MKQTIYDKDHKESSRYKTVILLELDTLLQVLDMRLNKEIILHIHSQL